MNIKHSQNHVHAPTTEKSSAQASASLAQGFSADLVQKCAGFNINSFHKTICSPLAGTNPIFTFFSRASSTDYLWTCTHKAKSNNFFWCLSRVLGQPTFNSNIQRLSGKKGKWANRALKMADRPSLHIPARQGVCPNKPR